MFLAAIFFPAQIERNHYFPQPCGPGAAEALCTHFCRSFQDKRYMESALKACSMDMHALLLLQGYQDYSKKVLKKSVDALAVRGNMSRIWKVVCWVKGTAIL